MLRMLMHFFKSMAFVFALFKWFLSNFRMEKYKAEENLSKFLNNMAYKTVTSMGDCVMKRNFM